MKRQLFDVGTQTYFEEHEYPEKLDREFAERAQFCSEEFVEWHYADGRIERYTWFLGEWDLVSATRPIYEVYEGEWNEEGN